MSNFKSKFLQECEARGFLNQCTNIEEFDKQLTSGKPVVAYWGTDPTGASLHVGHLFSLMMIRLFQKCGNKPIILLGGATGQIGDPSGKDKTRPMMSLDTLQNNKKGIKKSIEKFIKFGDGPTDAILVDNNDWWHDVNYLQLLREIAPHISVNRMLTFESVKQRLSKEEHMSFLEFNYMILQAYDFYHLHKTYNCTLQLCGADQWGNVCAGVELTRKLQFINNAIEQGERTEVLGFSTPLLLDSNGKKLGKSEGNALWLDIHKTSGYELYQYLINSDDKMVESYLKIFTFLSPEEIMEVMRKHEKAPEKRIAQKTLAYEFIKDLHGKEEADKAVRISEALFSGNVGALSGSEIEDGFKSIPNFTIDKEEENIVDFLVHYGIASSKREAREFVTNRSISINGEKIDDLNLAITKSHAIDDKFIIVRRGKKKYHLGRF